jgi:hypothetical protein
MAEPDPVDEMEKLAKQVASSVFEIFKAWKASQAQAKSQAAEQQRTQEFAMAQQEKLLEGFREIMRGQNPNPVPLGQGSAPLSQAQTQALDDISRRETAIGESIGRIDDRLDQIDAEQEAILNPGEGGPKPDTDRLRELHEERTKLKKEKGELNAELQELSTERSAIQQGQQPGQIGVDPNPMGGVKPDSLRPETPELEPQTLDAPDEQVTVEQEQPDPIVQQTEPEPELVEAQKPAPLKPEAKKLEAQKLEVEQLQKKLDGVETRLDEIQMQQDYLNKVVSKDQWTQEDTQAMAELEKEQTSLKTQKSNLDGRLEEESRKLDSQELSAQIESVDGRLNEIQEQQDYLKKVPKDKWTQEDSQAAVELEKEQTSLKTQKTNLETRREKLETDGLKAQKLDAPQGPELQTPENETLEVPTGLASGPEGLEEPTVDLGGDSLGLDEDALSLKQTDISSVGMTDASPEPLGKGPKLPEGGLAPPTEGLGGPGVGASQIKLKGGSPGVVAPKNPPLGQGNAIDPSSYRDGSTGASLYQSGYFNRKRSQSMPNVKVGKGVS